MNRKASTVTQPEVVQTWVSNGKSGLHIDVLKALHSFTTMSKCGAVVFATNYNDGPVLPISGDDRCALLPSWHAMVMQG